MNPREPFGVNAPERRRSKRHSHEGRVRIRVDTTELAGEAANVSKSGILFFTDGDFRLTIEVEQDGVVQTHEGRLVRCERIKGDRRGWAVEFEQE